MGFDLSDISFVRGETGRIVFDPLVSAEVVRAAWELFQEHVGEGLPVSAIIYSHTHGDHWGGVRGIVDEDKVRSGEIPVIAPIDFMDFTVSENVYAGNAMNRRLFLSVRTSAARKPSRLCRSRAWASGFCGWSRFDRTHALRQRAD